MKLKLALLVVSLAAGAGASVALADHGGHGDHGDHHGDANACRPVHLSGTLAAQALSLAVAKGSSAGTTVALSLPAGSRANVEACTTGTGTTAVLTVRHIDIHVAPPAPPTTTTAQTTTTTG